MTNDFFHLIENIDPYQSGKDNAMKIGVFLENREPIEKDQHLEYKTEIQTYFSIFKNKLII